MGRPSFVPSVNGQLVSIPRVNRLRLLSIIEARQSGGFPKMSPSTSSWSSELPPVPLRESVQRNFLSRLPPKRVGILRLANDDQPINSISPSTEQEGNCLFICL